jgi:hypothetical protein
MCAVLALAGCSGGDSLSPSPGAPLPECPDADYSTCDVRDEACQERLLELAACVRGGSAPSTLKIEVLSTAEYVELLRKDAGPQPKLQHENRALSLFGLAPFDGVPFEDQLAEQAAFVAGQYRPEEKRVIVVDHGRGATSPEVDAVLVHELVHALQDSEHDLATWPSPDTKWTFDSSLAASTVVEGEASFYESRVSAPLLGLDHARVDFEAAFQSYQGRALVRAFDSQLLLDQSFRTIPYGIGALRAFHAWEQDGPSGLEPLWSDPPLTMQRVLAEAFDQGTPQEAGLDIPEPTTPDGLTLVGDDVLGAWGLALVMTKRLGTASRVSEAIPQALTWRGDHLWVYADEDDRTYALWQLELESAQAARELDDFFDELDVEHATSGSRVYVSYNMNERPASAALTEWGEAWLASGSD